MIEGLTGPLLVGAGLFCIGLAGVLLRRNTIIMLIAIELMLAAANLNFVAFWKAGRGGQELDGVMAVLFSLAIAAAEAAVGLALVLAVYRHRRDNTPDAGGDLES